MKDTTLTARIIHLYEWDSTARYTGRKVILGPFVLRLVDGVEAWPKAVQFVRRRMESSSALGRWRGSAEASEVRGRK